MMNGTIRDNVRQSTVRVAALAMATLAAVVCMAPRTAYGDGSVWLPDPATGYVNVSYVFQTADEFYRVEQKRPTPAGGEDLSQGTLWLNVNYAMSDSVALDAQAGWAKSDFVVINPGPAPDDSYSGFVDTTVGLTWRLVDEVISDAPSVAVRIGGILAGDYDTGYINSLGDGGNGYEISVIAGKFLGDRVGLSGELGYRDRDSDIPSEVFANVSALWVLNDQVTLGLDYRQVNAESGLDIGGPGFSPSRFPELEEDGQSLGLRLFWNMGSLGLNVFHARVQDGRNTAASNVTGATVSYFFDTL